MEPNTPPLTSPAGTDVAGSAVFKKILGTAEGYLKQPTRMKQLLTDTYRKASEKNATGSLANEAWDTVHTLYRLVKSSVSGEYTGVATTSLVGAAAVFIYFLSPIDLIPDFIPVLGLLDDAALAVWFSGTIKGELDKFHEWELTRPVVTEPAARPNAAARHGHSADAEAPAAAQPRADVAAMTTDSSRERSTDAADTGGNVR